MRCSLVQAEKAMMVNMDRLGMYVRIENKYGKSKIRVPFVRPVEDRKGLKEILVEMVRHEWRTVGSSIGLVLISSFSMLPDKRRSWGAQVAPRELGSPRSEHQHS
jgi:hypothetical protein